MRILLLTFYFEPDLCAGSFRNTALVKALSKHLEKEDHLDVITTMPNRYSTYQANASEFEKYASNIHIYRSELPQHKSGFFDQINSFRAYYTSVTKQVKNKDYDLVIASSSRLFTAFLGARISSRKKIPLYLDMRDLFRENMLEIITNPLINYPLSLVLKWIENYTFRKADRFNIVSEGFRDFFDRFGVPVVFHPNGIDTVFLGQDFDSISSNGNEKIITYAGNIGDGQGLHKVIPQIAHALQHAGFIFKVIGDGGTRSFLELEIKRQNVTNVELIDPVNRDELMKYYKDTDYLFLHLNDYKAFKKVLPSKIFEYAATGKPILAGVGGYARDFLKKYVDGVLVFDPCDSKSVIDVIQNNQLKAGQVSRREFINSFSRDNIMDKMARDIIHEYRK